MHAWPEILLIDKPTGITSFDVIRRLRKIYIKTCGGKKAPKMGHAGTLDPLATGLMIIGIGTGTKKLQLYLKLDKVYVAEVLIGESRTTGDMEGEVMEEKRVVETVEILRSKISTALSEMSGLLVLPVSAYSAIKKDGVPMYKRARAAEKKGKEVTEVPVREMRVYGAKLLNVKTIPVNWSSGFDKMDGGDGKAVATIRFYVASGTYIRSLAEELGRRLGYPATIKGLRRMKVGEFDINSAYSLEDI